MRVLGSVDPRMERWEPIIRAVVGRYRPQGELYDDLLQDARVAVWRALNRIQDLNGTAEAYVNRTAQGAIQHFFRDRYAMVRAPAWRQERGEKPPVVASLDELMDDDEEGGEVDVGLTDTDAEEQRDLAEDAATVHAAMEHLTERERRALRMHFEGYLWTDVGREFGVSGGYAATIARGALAKVRSTCERSEVSDG